VILREGTKITMEKGGNADSRNKWRSPAQKGKRLKNISVKGGLREANAVSRTFLRSKGPKDRSEWGGHDSKRKSGIRWSLRRKLKLTGIRGGGRGR